MGLGILEDHVLEHVPGTARMEDESLEIRNGELDPNLKYDTSGPIPILLIPQPSDDPNDPLNWSILRRDLIVVVLCLISIMAATLSPILAANTLYLSFYFGRQFTDVALLTGWHLFAVGVSGFVFVATGTVYGKRHLYILGNLLLIASCFWAAGSQDYKSLLGARILQGVAVAPFEALVNASVGDLYPVHQRGKRMALTNLALYGGAFLTPVFVGIMTKNVGWRWPFYTVAIGSTVLLPFVILFVPETAFRRSSRLNTDIGQAGHQLESLEPTPTASEANLNTGTDGSSNDSGEVNAEEKAHRPRQYQRDSFVRSLRLFSGRKTDDVLWKLVLRPLPLFLHPAMIWAMLTQGMLIAWTVMIGVDLAAVFAAPPLWFDEAKTGYTYTGAFIGALVGFVLSGWLSDFSAKLLTKWNKGIYEPEFRMFLVIPQTIFGVIGLYGFGFSGANPAKYGWIWPSFFFGFEVCGMIIGAVASALYVVDAYRHISVEAFTCLLMFKNFISFGLTWEAYDWLIKLGVWDMFRIIGSVQLGLCLLTIPMYVYGKQFRSFSTRHDILKMLGLY